MTHMFYYRLVRSALDYFISLTSEGHRSSWQPVLLLLFTRILQLTNDEVTMVTTVIMVIM